MCPDLAKATSDAYKAALLTTTAQVPARLVSIGAHTEQKWIADLTT